MTLTAIVSCCKNCWFRGLIGWPGMVCAAARAVPAAVAAAGDDKRAALHRYAPNVVSKKTTENAMFDRKTRSLITNKLAPLRKRYSSYRMRIASAAMPR